MLKAAAEINHHNCAKGDIAMWTAAATSRLQVGIPFFNKKNSPHSPDWEGRTQAKFSFVSLDLLCYLLSYARYTNYALHDSRSLVLILSLICKVICQMSALSRRDSSSIWHSESFQNFRAVISYGEFFAVSRFFSTSYQLLVVVDVAPDQRPRKKIKCKKSMQKL